MTRTAATPTERLRGVTGLTLPHREGRDRTLRITAFEWCADNLTMEVIRRRAHGEPSGSPFDAFAGLVADACDAPVGVASRIDRSGSWRDAFVVCAPARAIDRADAFRDETLAAPGVVTFDDGVRSYAGIALTSEAGRRFGTIAAIDATGRTFAVPELDALRGIGAALVRTIDARRTKSSYDGEQIGMLGAALELVADPIAIFRRRGVGLMPWFVYVNRAFTELFGYTTEDVVGKEPKILTGPDTGTAAREKILKAQGAAPIDYGTLALYTASGRRVLVEMVTHHLHPSHRTVSYRDVTRERVAQAALADANQRLFSLVSINSDAIFTFDCAGACVDANPSAEAVTGLTRDALLGTGLHAVAKDGLFPRGERFPNALVAGRALDFTSHLRRRDGASVTVECKAIPIAVRGVTEGAYVFAKDVTESRRLATLVRKQAERATALCAIAALAEETDAEQIDAALELVLDSFGMHYAYVAEFVESELTITSSVGERIYNVADVVKLARKAVSAFHERGEVVTIDDIMRTPDLPSEARRYDGWHAYIFAPLNMGEGGRGALGFVSRDVRAFDDADRDFIRLVASLISSALERRRQNHQLDRLAYFDELSGLPNRAQFRRRLEREVAAAGNTFALHFVDLDGFKALNDRAGHAIGDLALRETSRRLERMCRRDDMPARLGGDEFVVIQAGARNRRDAGAFGARIVERLSQPYALEGAQFELGASVGVALFPADGNDEDALMRRADAALYRAKSLGKRRVELANDPDAGRPSDPVAEAEALCLARPRS